MTEIESLVETHLDTWNAPAGDERAAAVARVYTDEVEIGEPGARLTGHAGMQQAITGLQAMVPGAVLTRTDPVQVVQDLVTYRWSFGVPGSAPAAAGRDVLLVHDGRIRSLYVVIDTP